MAIKARITKIFFGKSEKVFIFAIPFSGSYIGEMLEWLKRHAWKACIRQKRIPSSNLGLSANRNEKRRQVYLSAFFHFDLSSPPQAGGDVGGLLRPATARRDGEVSQVKGYTVAGQRIYRRRSKDIPSQVCVFGPTCDGICNRRPICVAGQRKNADLRRFGNRPATLHILTCDTLAGDTLASLGMTWGGGGSACGFVSRRPQLPSPKVGRKRREKRAQGCVEGRNGRERIDRVSGPCFTAGTALILT